MWLRKLLGLLFVLSVFAVQAQADDLLEAANYNDIDMARQLLEQGADINDNDKVEKTPVMLCQADSIKRPVRETSATATNPAEAQRYFNRCLAAVEIAKTPDDYDLAISEFQKARSLDPGRADICYNLGLIQEKAGKFKDAANSLRQYLKLAPNSPDAETVRTLVDKLEFKAEQVITDEEALDIFVSLTDSSRWQLNGISNATVFQNHAWVKSLSRSSQPGHQNRLRFEFPCGVCSPALKGVGQGDALPTGKSVEFETFYCPCEGIKCVFKYNYHLEVISRNKVKMLLKVRWYNGGTDVGTFEFVRR
jgi:tetratricopeptide (TPR) repeat protein